MKKIIGLIFADDMEYKPFAQYALSHGGTLISSNPQNTMHMETEKADIYAIESGVGKVNAAVGALELIKTYNVDCVLNGGLSGAISDVVMGDVVAGTEYTECDFDMRPLGYKLGEKPDGIITIKADEELLRAALKIDGMKNGPLGTGDIFLTDSKKKAEFCNAFNLKAFDMESAAAAYTCKKYSTPFLSIRKVSDNADESSKEDYREMNNLCEVTLTEILMEVIELL